MGKSTRPTSQTNKATMASYEDVEAGHTSKRKRLSSDILDVLHSFFAVNESPTMDERNQLSGQTGVDQRAIQVWFQNRRAKLRRESTSPALFSEPQGIGRQRLNSSARAVVSVPVVS